MCYPNSQHPIQKVNAQIKKGINRAWTFLKHRKLLFVFDKILFQKVCLEKDK